MLHSDSRPYLYLAGPLFSAAERSYNTFLKQELSRYVDVYLPQEDGALMPQLLDTGMSIQQASKVVFTNDVNAIKRSNILLIVLDGRAVDEGAAFELGVAYMLRKRCVALQTDFRRLAPFGNNPMLEGAVEATLESPAQVIDWLKKTNLVKA